MNFFAAPSADKTWSVWGDQIPQMRRFWRKLQTCYCLGSLPNVAFDFNLHHYTKEITAKEIVANAMKAVSGKNLPQDNNGTNDTSTRFRFDVDYYGYCLNRDEYWPSLFGEAKRAVYIRNLTVKY